MSTHGVSQISDERRHWGMYAAGATTAAMRAGESVSEFDALFRGSYSRVCRLVRRVVGSSGLAEELAAEAFWRLHEKRPAHLTNAEAWLYRTAVGLALDHRRKNKRRLHYESALPRPSHSSEEELDRERQQAMVRQVLVRLKSIHSELLLMRAEGLTYAEVATALKLNPASIGTMIARAERAFRKEYEKRHGQR